MKWMMFIKHLQTLGIAGAGKAIKSLGFEGVDFTVRPNGSVLPENVRKELPEAQKIFADLGLQVPLITTAITNVRDAHVADVFETAAACGIRELKLGYVSYKKFGSFQQLLADVQKDLDGITSLAHSTGVRANIHTHSGPYISTNPAIVWQLLKDRDPASIGAYADPAHMTVEGSRDGWRQGLDLLGPRINLVAVKDMAWEEVDDAKLHKKRWQTRIVPLNRGAVAWPEVFDCLKQLNYNGWVSIHAEYQGGHTWKDMTVPELIEQTREDLAYLRKAVLDANVPSPAPTTRL
ncbi:MAG: sugar phosphate isomerase/epimerase [Planctomycetota bacterium]|nr:sugar phosphate isomerase/epimerase [Planctomycetota bacterium]